VLIEWRWSTGALELIEIAPGIDVKTQVLDQMEFEPLISPNLKTMDPMLFEL
jgi:propionate CoA-transferase